MDLPLKRGLPMLPKSALIQGFLSAQDGHHEGSGV